MAVRIAGVTLPPTKRLKFSLPSIYGIGQALAEKLCREAGLDPYKKTDQLSEPEVAKLREVIEHGHRVEGELRREIVGNIKRLKEIGAYRGLRHGRRLPVRGQRTRTNSRTVRGNVRRTMGSGRRAASEKT